jgi:3-hydroxyisobutyrate dehydrogenase-like beta-hydroxyacid dehydrogenase
MQDYKKKQITIVGYGQIGKIVKKLIDKVYKVNICTKKSYNKKLFNDSDFVILCLRNNCVETVNRISGWTKKSCIFIDHSTSNPNDYNKIKDKINVLDCPITKSHLSLPFITMVGGKKTILDKAQSLLKLYCDKIIHIGVLGEGQKAKLVNQLCQIYCLCGVNDAIKLSKTFKLPSNKIHDMLLSGSANCVQLKNYKELRRGSYKNQHIEKEIKIMLDCLKVLTKT